MRVYTTNQNLNNGHVLCIKNMGTNRCVGRSRLCSCKDRIANKKKKIC